MDSFKRGLSDRTCTQDAQAQSYGTRSVTKFECVFYIDNSVFAIENSLFAIANNRNYLL